MCTGVHTDANRQYVFMERKPLKGKANELENEGRARLRMQGRQVNKNIL